MIKVLGENYYVDLDRIESYLDMGPTPVTDNGETETRINVLKFDMVKMLLETVLSENEDGVDDKLGMKSSNNTSIPFRIAFNSLLYKKIITKY